MKSINILVLGKSGVGKSSLLNYLVEKNICETGVGSPVTQNYFDNYIFTNNYKNINYNLLDTKGIEPAETKQFIEIIEKKIKSFEANSSIFDKLHTIYYCIAASSKRIETFEIEFIKKLKANIPIIIILTKSDLVDENTIQELKKHLEVSLGYMHIIQVCSVEHHSRKGITQPFGRDQVLKHSFVGIWDKLYFLLEEQFNSTITKTTKDSLDYLPSLGIKSRLYDHYKASQFYSETFFNFFQLLHLPSLSALYLDDLHDNNLHHFRDLMTLLKNFSLSLKSKIEIAINDYILKKNEYIDELLDFYTHLTSSRINKKPFFSSDAILPQYYPWIDTFKKNIDENTSSMETLCRLVEKSNKIERTFHMDGSDKLKKAYESFLNQLDILAKDFDTITNNYKHRLDAELKQYHRLILQIEDDNHIEKILTEDYLTQNEYIYYKVLLETCKEINQLTAEGEIILSKLAGTLDISTARKNNIDKFFSETKN